MTEKVPTARQLEFANLPLEAVLLVAPAGCGKTEALAQRAAAVIARGEVTAPRKLLAVTYSNKAMQSLTSRTRTLMGRNWQQWIKITNFHGLASRVIRAHGAVIGLDPQVILPDKVWRKKKLRELGAEWDDHFDAVLREAKAGAVDDGVVMGRLEEAGYTKAIAFEQALRAEGRIDYDDQLRHASRILADPTVARLYRAHFRMVMVDEVQDLSMRQLNMVLAVGGGYVTFAGDPAQGIFAFAGAQPDDVFATIHHQDATVVELDESYRSSPAVLRAINSLADLTGAVELRCGAPENFPDEGQVLLVSRSTTTTEADALADLLDGFDLTATSVGFVTRRWRRLDELRRALRERDVDSVDWELPTHIARVVALMNRHGAGAAGATDLARVDALEALCCKAIAEDDAETHDEIVMACEALRDLVAEGMSFDAAVATCRAAPDPDAPVPPGVHLLNGHVGKGQEFDWVVVVGLEDGHIPDYRNVQDDKLLAEELRILHVMLSRARYGLILTSADHTMTKYGWREAEPSRWLARLAGTATATV